MMRKMIGMNSIWISDILGSAKMDSPAKLGVLLSVKMCYNHLHSRSVIFPIYSDNLVFPLYSQVELQALPP